MRRSPIATVNAIRLKRQVHKGCFLVVEGREDRLFFKKFVDPNDCRITVAYGKEEVIAVVTKLDIACFSGVVGVVDADLEHTEGGCVEVSWFERRTGNEKFTKCETRDDKEGPENVVRLERPEQVETRP